MFNLKRTLTAAALSTALAGGIVGLGTAVTTTSANASAITVAGAGKCVWLTGGGHVRRGHIKNHVNANFEKGFGWHIKRERGCTRERHIGW